MVEAILKRLLTAAIEAFPIDKTRKAIVLKKYWRAYQMRRDVKQIFRTTMTA